MYDYHIHSHFSPDSLMEMECIIKKAIELGVTEICCTDHMDYGYSYMDKLFEFNPKHYFEEHKRLVKTYGNQITIRSGIEVGIQRHLLKRCRELVTGYQFDFILASIHSVENISLTKTDLQKKYGAEGLWQRYFAEMLFCIKNFNSFNVLGHIDVPKRYNPKMKNSSLKPHYPIIKEIYKYLINNGKGIEVNSAGLHYYKLNDFNPSKDLLQIYYECGGEILTFGSDSHNYEQIAKNYHEVISTLRDIGFKYICTYKNQQAIFHNIK